MEITLVASPLWTSAELADLKIKAAQLIIDSDMANFWATGSVA